MDLIPDRIPVIDASAHAASTDLLADAVASRDEVVRLARALDAPHAAARVSEPLLPLVVAALWKLRADAAKPTLGVLVEDDEAARELAEAAAWFLPPESPVGYLPSRGVAYGSGLDPAAHLVGERAHALALLHRGGLVAISAEALCERVPRACTPAPSPSSCSAATSSIATT